MNFLQLKTMHGWMRLRLSHCQHILSNGVAPGSEITTCIEIDKPLVVYRFWWRP